MKTRKPKRPRHEVVKAMLAANPRLTHAMLADKLGVTRQAIDQFATYQPRMGQRGRPRRCPVCPHCGGTGNAATG